MISKSDDSQCHPSFFLNDAPTCNKYNGIYMGQKVGSNPEYSLYQLPPCLVRSPQLPGRVFSHGRIDRQRGPELCGSKCPKSSLNEILRRGVNEQKFDAQLKAANQQQRPNSSAHSRRPLARQVDSRTYISGRSNGR